MTVYQPVRAPHASGRIEVVDMAAVEFGVAIHPGSHDDIDVIYGRLGSWVASNALAVDGPVYERHSRHGLGDRLISHDAGLEELGDHLSQGVDGLPPVGREQIPGNPPVG